MLEEDSVKQLLYFSEENYTDVLIESLGVELDLNDFLLISQGW